MRTIAGIVFTVVFLSFAVMWVLFATRRLRPWVRQKLGESMGVRINERILFRSQAWEIKEPHNWQQGCLVTIVQSVVDFGCMVLPLFGALGLLGALMILLSDS